MKKVFKSTPGAVIVLGALALAIAAAGGAWAASGGGAGKITVCVSKSGGALYQAKKCQKKDKKLSWSIQGPQGPKGAEGADGKNGKDGTNGANGKNGAVAGLSAAQSGVVNLNGTEKTVLTLDLPAGSFIVQGKVQVGGTATSAGYMNDSCTLADGSASNDAQFSAPLTPAQFLGIHIAETSMPMQIAVTTTSPSTVTLGCENVSSEGTAFSTGATDSVISAVQTSGNS
ncbi:MAG TPA: hypothetical protein VGI73_05345 [Solirubrobacterales bacterium]|jgi:hypothetical protein